MSWYPRTKSRNKYECSDGERVTQRQIDRNRSEAYRKDYEENPSMWCEGCGQLAQCHAHIIPQARCKQIRKTELIWAKSNFFRSCFKCNSAIENPKGQAWRDLKNIEKYLIFMIHNDRELFNKFAVQMSDDELSEFPKLITEMLALRKV